MLMPHRGYLSTYPIPMVGTPRDPQPAIGSVSEPGARSGAVSSSGPESEPEAASGSKSSSGAPSDSGRERWQGALLEELIYERVRLNVDLLELVDFERDLAESIERALAACGAAEDRDRLASDYLERAWARLERDWRAARDDDDHPLQCPLCGELASTDP
jgi:hypothetical protein